MHYLPQEISAIRKAAEDALRPAFAHSDVANVSDWIQRCIDDQAQLWRLRGYWLISEVQDTKNGRAVHLVFSAGVYERAQWWAASWAAIANHPTQ